mmetsp:Transcript_28083/g.47112  ORF Transcript_28083/g.47112 Transcript_28083/m.47112 type:complete len:123 (-) Transcript_28083:37-405(-)
MSGQRPSDNSIEEGHDTDWNPNTYLKGRSRASSMALSTSIWNAVSPLVPSVGNTVSRPAVGARFTTTVIVALVEFEATGMLTLEFDDDDVELEGEGDVELEGEGEVELEDELERRETVTVKR